MCIWSENQTPCQEFAEENPGIVGPKPKPKLKTTNNKIATFLSEMMHIPFEESEQMEVLLKRKGERKEDEEKYLHARCASARPKCLEKPLQWWFELLPMQDWERPS
jgi:hypothetical protein